MHNLIPVAHLSGIFIGSQLVTDSSMTQGLCILYYNFFHNLKSIYDCNRLFLILI